MGTFPVFLKLKDRSAIVVGGTAAAARKARALVDAGARVVVVAPNLDLAFESLVRDQRIAHIAETFSERHLAGGTLVVAADGDPAINATVSCAAQARAILVNVVDRPDLCSFMWPAIVDRSPVVVAVSSDGTAPILARLVRARIEALLPQGLAALAQLAAAVRPLVARTLKDARTRRRFWEGVFAGRVSELAFAGRAEGARRALMVMLAHAADREMHSRLETVPGVIVSVAVVANDPEDLTLRTIRLLQGADVIVHDRSIASGILDYARREADRIAIDPTEGVPARMLAMLARGGRRIVRLQAQAAPSAETDSEICDRGDSAWLRVVQAEG